jgi:hypothetical protein
MSSLFNRLRLLMLARRRPAQGVSTARALEAHVAHHFGEGFEVLREEKPASVRVDVYVVKPGAGRPFYTVLTSGMSDRAMTVPAGMEDLAFTEVCLCLPADWDMQDFWPIRLLKAIARYPHLTKSWVAWGQTIPNPAALDPGGRFVGVLLTAPGKLPLGAEEVRLEDGREVRYLAVVPLLEGEMKLAMEHGGEELDSALTAAGVTELIDPARVTVF